RTHSAEMQPLRMKVRALALLNSLAFPLKSW
ncbi:MAG: hypothetical protein RLY63_851, partial [Chloroflexota bacterium]